MAANVATGRVRVARYCGAEYTVRPSSHPDAVTGRKQVWEVCCEGWVIRPWVINLSKCVYYIHEHSVESATYPAKVSDGLSYDQLVGRLCR
jgi:hypothetical protein